MLYNNSLIETVVKLNSETAGRDRLIRLLQYGSKLVGWWFQRASRDQSLAVRMQDLEYSLSTARKLFRFGRFIDILYGALKTIHLPDPTVRSTLTLSKIGQSLFLLTDHILWIGRVGLLRVDKAKWTKQSNQFWLLSIVFALLRDLYELWVAFDCESKIKSRKPRHSPIINCFRNHKDVALDTLKNGCDLWLPATTLGYTKLSPGMVGLLGVISSFVGILTVIDATLKLTPS